MRISLILFVVASLISFAGCSSDNSGAQAACNSLVNSAPSVSGTMVAAAPPVPVGGAIIDGSYVLSALTSYTGPGGSTGSLTDGISTLLVISGTTMQQVGSINGQELRYTTTISTSGTTISTVDTCPAPSTSQHGYTASATELRIYNTSSSQTLEQTYTKQ